jgi:CHRD domain
MGKRAGARTTGKGRYGMKKVWVLTAVLMVAALTVFGATALATGDKGKKRFSATLTGFQEVPSISTGARGTFRATLEDDTLEYRLSYSGIEGGTAVFGHIHLGQRGVNGGVSVFLCGGGDKPACPATGGTVTGVIDPADVIGPVEQGIGVGEFDELVRAMRAGVTYANVHSVGATPPLPSFPGGEIRGQIR